MYCLINFGVCYFFEKIIVAYLVKNWYKKQYLKNSSIMKRKEIEPTFDLINDVKNYVKENEKNKRRFNSKKKIEI